MMPALAIRMLMGPWWSTASWMQALIVSSEEISPFTLNRCGDGVILVMGRRSCAVTLQP